MIPVAQRRAALSRRLLLALVITSALGSAQAQALQPIVDGATIFRDTVVGIALILMTAGWGLGGYRIMFAGANFRDVANLFVGGAVCGGAAAIAATFI